ncbi:MAG: hypothetical protein Unbinned1446contig1005_45 [Prokaryotic dsDNA virus sp.]|nr:MAG: hypothetical protein Unbinned1446contig1005_45 [Prokaryotic dsDNA virus sp.]|tara:strand:+ start:3369 stop:3926 length:558 start_codon:yes stop_codon:yes gene_type:complete
MGFQKLTDKTALTSTSDDDLLHIVDVSDTTGSAAGTSKKIQVQHLLAGAAGGSNHCLINGSFFDNLVRSVYLPVGNTETEFTSLQRSNKFVAPAAGKVIKVVMRHEGSTPSSGNLTVTLREVSMSNTITNIEAITVTPSYASRMITAFDFTSAAVLAADTTYAFFVTNGLGVALGNVSFTIQIEL